MSREPADRNVRATRPGESLAPPRLLRGKWFAAEPNHFHGADDAARVLAVNFFISRRVAFTQFGQQFFQRRGFEFGAQFRVGGRRFAKSFEKGFEVKSGAAAKDRHATARLDLHDSLMREPGELRGVERFGQVADVNEVMRHAGAVGGRWLGRADVESAIDLHGIGGNDFTAELPGKAQGDFRFSDGGRAGDEEGTRLCFATAWQGWRMDF